MEKFISEKVKEAVFNLYNIDIKTDSVQLQNTRKDIKGDLTVVVFPFLRYSKKSPEETGRDIGEYLIEKIDEINDYNIIKGFLNIVLSQTYWLNILNNASQDENYGIISTKKDAKTIIIEYSSPNTNKPLHLGHIRNNLLGYSISKILAANGNKVIKLNLVNDRGIHICKSMLAWQKWGNNISPQESGKKGDHLVGDFYVKFDQEYKKQIASLKDQGIAQEEAAKKAPLIIEAQEMLKKWEDGDKDVRKLWETMNSWVYEGFEQTYKAMGVDFDSINYESETYLLGKKIVQKGLDDKILYKKEDGSIWADLTDNKLDQKLLLRSDGTSVYMTQDIGTAKMRYDEYQTDEMIYVVGNEQDYHFQVLSIILAKLGFPWGKNLTHLSYGMVELPEGKMKSREGTVVDADDLMKEMIDTAGKMSEELGKLDNYSAKEMKEIVTTVAMGALKYFILKVDPKKNMTFNPKESIDFNGNTGPFIQYTFTRINSLLTKAKENSINIPKTLDNISQANEKEIELIKLIDLFPHYVEEAGKKYSPAIIANYIYTLVKEFNQYYHDFPILKEKEQNILLFRLVLSKKISEIISSSLNLLGIDVPERM